MDTKALTGKTAVVTGGSKGFGAGIAAALRRNGADVWITGRDEKALQRTADAIKVRWIKADVTCGGDWDNVIQTVLQSGNAFDILVNNAGAGIRVAPLEEHSDEEIAAAIAVNLTGAILGCRRAAAVMKKKKAGVIVNISSMCAREAWPSWTVYSAAKAGLVQFSNCLYTELRGFGVHVTSVIPSWGATEFAVAARLPGFDKAMAAKCIQPDEFGDFIVTLCALPSHLAVPEVTLLPLVQEIIPL